MSVAFDPIAILGTLAAVDVRYVVIGGMASVAYGSPSITKGLDICYERTPDNLERLADVLRSLHARLRGVDDDVPSILDAETLARGDHFAFMTDAGPFDCLGTPAGSAGFAQLDANAIVVDFGGIEARVVAIDDLIRMKGAAGRPQDLKELEILGALREELEARGEL